MLIRLFEENIDQRRVTQIIDILQSGGIIIYPTDTVYSMGCDIMNQKAVEKVAKLKGIEVERSRFSFICYDLSHLSDYARPIPNPVFKLMKRNLPGPFTFILEASNNIPKLFKNKKKTVGIRIPNHNIPLEIVKKLGNPLLTTSIHDYDEIIEYTTDPEIIHDNFGHLVDIVIDGGYGNNIPSTVVNCTIDPPEILRQGLGIFEE